MVHSGGKEKGSTAHPCWASTTGEPVPVKPLHETDGVGCDSGSLVPEFKEGCEAGDVVRWIDEGELEVEGLDELEIDVA
jgi:hypothetical protein